MKSGKINEQPLIGGEYSEQRRTWEILRCLFGRVFDAIFELHLIVNREWLQFLWQGKWPVKKKKTCFRMVSLTAACRMNLWGEKRGRECVVRSKEIRASGKKVKRQNVGSVEAHLQPGASGSAPRKWAWLSESQKKTRKDFICFSEA